MQIWKLCASLSVKLNVWIVWKHVRKIYCASPNAFGITNLVSMVSQLWPRFESLVVPSWYPLHRRLFRLSVWLKLSQWVPRLSLLFLQPDNNIWVNDNCAIINGISTVDHHSIFDYKTANYKTDQYNYRRINFGTNYRSEPRFNYRDSNDTFYITCILANDADDDYDHF